jgi:hypothetical protein
MGGYVPADASSGGEGGVCVPEGGGGVRDLGSRASDGRVMAKDKEET